MRLIDADVFRKRYCEENCGNRKCVDDFDRCNFISELNNQTTAYDVDAVVKQLENLKCKKEIGSHKVMIREAIDIVKGGGIDGI